MRTAHNNAGTIRPGEDEQPPFVVVVNAGYRERRGKINKTGRDFSFFRLPGGNTNCLI